MEIYNVIWRPTAAFGQAGNSRYSDMEVSGTFKMPDGSEKKIVSSTMEGLEYWAERHIAGCVNENWGGKICPKCNKDHYRH